MRCSRRSLLKSGALGALSLAVPAAHSTIARASTVDRLPRIMEKVPSICGLCKANCPVLALKDARGGVRLTGNPASPIHGRNLCARGMAAVQLLNDPDRLKYPLKRVGMRGMGDWKRITWQEAISEIGSQISKAMTASGPEALALLCGSSSASFIRRFFEGLDSPHIYDSSHMHSAAIRELGYGTVYGRVPDPAYMPQLDEADCLVLMGCHIGENNQVAQLKQVSDFVERGGELIVVDPRFSAMASKASQYMAIRPGTDTALVLAWINYILNQELLDPFLVERFVGLEELQEVVADYDLPRTAEITGLSQEQIVAALEAMVAAAPATVIMPGSHLSWYGNDVDRVRAQAILSALLGYVPTTGKDFDFEAQRKQLSFAKLLHKIGSGMVKVTGIWGQNPLQAEMAPYKTMAALKKAEFIFACDVLPSEPTLYADIVLPECSFLERMDDLQSWDIGTQLMTGCRFPVTAPPHECRDPYQIVRALAQACGQETLFKANRVQDYVDDSLVGQGTSLDLMKKAGGLLFKNKPSAEVDSPGPEMVESIDDMFAQPEEAPPPLEIPTPSGKIEFHSAWLAHNGYNPLPNYEPPAQTPDGYLRLLYGRCPAHSLTRTAGFSWLNYEVPENEVWVNDQVASKLGLQDGEQVRLENSDGFRSLTLAKIKITPGIRPDCCYMSHGFGNRSQLIRAAYLRGVSDSGLMNRGKVDPVSGTRGLRDTFVRILRGNHGAQG